MEKIFNLNNYFEYKLNELDCDRETKSYISSIFIQFKKSELNFSKESITLLYKDAKEEQNFQKLQNIADWLFFCQTLYPEHLNNASEEYYQSIGRLSYYSCFKLINKRIRSLEKLADDFVPLTINTRIVLAF